MRRGKTALQQFASHPFLLPSARDDKVDQRVADGLEMKASAPQSSKKGLEALRLFRVNVQTKHRTQELRSHHWVRLSPFQRRLVFLLVDDERGVREGLAQRRQVNRAAVDVSFERACASVLLHPEQQSAKGGLESMLAIVFPPRPFDSTFCPLLPEAEEVVQEHEKVVQRLLITSRPQA